MPSEKTRKVYFEEGFDCIRFECRFGKKSCAPGKGGSHGKHGLQIRWVVSGEEGAVQFLLFTGWMPEPSEEVHSTTAFGPYAADLGYHSKAPRYEGQEPIEGCKFIEGRCYYDGSGLNAKEPFRVLCSDGGEALWQYLEKYYEHVFHEAEFPEDGKYKLKMRA